MCVCGGGGGVEVSKGSQLTRIFFYLGGGVGLGGGGARSVEKFGYNLNYSVRII